MIRNRTAETLTALALTLGTMLALSIVTAHTYPAEGAERHRHAHARHVSPPIPSAAVPCASEDGSGGPLPCHWLAGKRGNGIGHSFWLDRHDRIHFLSDRYDFRERMESRGWERTRRPVDGHALCYVQVSGDAVRCFDGYRTAI